MLCSCARSKLLAYNIAVCFLQVSANYKSESHILISIDHANTVSERIRWTLNENDSGDTKAGGGLQTPNPPPSNSPHGDGKPVASIQEVFFVGNLHNSGMYKRVLKPHQKGTRAMICRTRQCNHTLSVYYNVSGAHHSYDFNQRRSREYGISNTQA